MTDSNQKTVESYEHGVNQYIQNSPNRRSGPVEDWIDKSLEGLAKEARILEFGSAYGRDAGYMESKGFYVEKTDVTQGFVDILKQKDPKARLLNAITDDIPGTYELIIANAVLLHFTTEETVHVTEKVLRALQPGGRFALTLKQGDGEGWLENKGMGPRYFNYWQRDDIVELLSKLGFIDINAWVDESDSANATWIMVIAEKP
jgi:SAM-dependent methyltransferase